MAMTLKGAEPPLRRDSHLGHLIQSIVVFLNLDDQTVALTNYIRDGASAIQVSVFELNSQVNLMHSQG